MDKTVFTKFARSVKLTLAKHGPEILTGIGISGIVTTTILAVRATPKALELIKEAEEERDEPLSKIDVMKVAWKPYIPAAITGTLSIGCLIGGSSVSNKRTAALAAAYQLSESALSEYKEKVIETIGEKKEQAVREKISESRIEKNPIENSKIIFTDKGTVTCYEPISGRYFKSDIDTIKRVVNDVNEAILSGPFGYMSLNEFYDELGLESTEMGDDLGWSIDNGIIRLDYHAKIADNGEPCIVIDYANPPVYDYNKFA